MSFNFMVAVTFHSDFGGLENKVCTISIVSPSICREVTGCHVLCFLNVEF